MTRHNAARSLLAVTAPAPDYRRRRRIGSTQFDLEYAVSIYRMGYYGGAGARPMRSLGQDFGRSDAIQRITKNILDRMIAAEVDRP